MLLNNEGDNLTVNANGNYTFLTALASGEVYHVTIGQQPTGQTCSVTSGSGTIASSNITNVAVSCVNNAPPPSATYTVGGNVTGLATDQSVTVQDNSGDTLVVTADGPFTFATALATGASYAVTVSAQPAGQTCSVTSGSGTMASSNITNVAVNCITHGLVSTFAGSTTAGSADGTGAAASFNSPAGVATDASGNVYVADSANNEIRKISPAGVVTTLAGSTTAGSADGTGAAASFNSPEGVATDASGNVYVADAVNHEIRKISPAGVVTTLAGFTAPGSADGTGAAARFHGPAGVATDASGNVYVADTGNHEIRKISPAGVVTTLAGSTTAGSADGTGAAASFNHPLGVATDASGNVYVGDSYNNEIRKISPAGVVTTLAGSTAFGSADGSGAAARFHGPFGGRHRCQWQCLCGGLRQQRDSQDHAVRHWVNVDGAGAR
nr:NHL repeat-containing protein [Halothiobacillus sp.]